MSKCNILLCSRHYRGEAKMDRLLDSLFYATAFELQDCLRDQTAQEILEGHEKELLLTKKTSLPPYLGNVGHLLGPNSDTPLFNHQKNVDKTGKERSYAHVLTYCHISLGGCTAHKYSIALRRLDHMR